MMNNTRIDYLGNLDLLKLHKTAFLAASAIPPDMVLKCYDWAVRMANEGQCIISGYSSYLEREVLHFLMKGSQPIILVLARQIYKEMPPELQRLLDENRLLIISASKAVRQSKATALTRNKYICEIADQILFVGVNEKSSLHSLYNQYATKAYTMI
jgi:predicted Rossmann fold nucleotide-binding protein DprA/Smf involved in DNA uptake